MTYDLHDDEVSWMKGYVAHVVLVLAGTLLLQSWFFGAHAAAKGGTVLGELTQFGEPVADALVQLLGDGVQFETRSDAEGRYTFANVPAGMYTVLPSQTDTSFLPKVRTVHVGEGDVQVEVEPFRSVPFLLPEPKMDPELGKSLPLGGGEGYTLTPDPSEATYTVKPSDVASLVETLKQARPGDLVYLPPGEYVFDDPGEYTNSTPLITVPAGVTLFGTRDQSILRTLPIDDVPVNHFTFIEMGDNSRITGITVIGPDTETGPLQGYIEQDGRTIATAYYKPTASGISISGRTEVDNMVVIGFPYAAVVLRGPQADGFVHHSYIAENVRTGLGYGVLPLDGAYVEVAYTKFYRNRHSMDATGGSYYVHDSYFDNENPMGIGVIFQHPQKVNGVIVIQDNTIVNAIRAIHMVAGHGVISGNVIEASAWGIALRNFTLPDRHASDNLGYLNRFEIFDNEVRSGDYYLEPLLPQDQVFLDGVNVGNLIEFLGGRTQTIPLAQWPKRLETWLAELPATAPLLEIKHPVADRERPIAVRGPLAVDFDLNVPKGWEIEGFEARVNDEVIYRGNTAPARGELVYDTVQLPNGRHQLQLTARARYNDHRTTVTERVTFRADNFWTLTDELRAPVTSGWFGSVDLSQTVDASEGWTYATDDRDAFFRDGERKVRTGNTTEYLVWETPRLLDFTVTLYAKESAISKLAELVEFHATADAVTSADGSDWTEVSTVIDVSEPSSAGWHRIIFTGSIDGQNVTHLRLTVNQSDVHHEIQIGRVELRGLNENKPSNIQR